MKTEYGLKAVALPRYFAKTPFAFLLVLLLKSIVFFVKEIAKNTFCQGIFPVGEITIVLPPSGDPEANPQEFWLLQRTLYGLWCSACHWSDKINVILRSIGLTQSLEDPCLYLGFVHDPSAPSGPKLTSPLTLGLYVDDFVYFSEDPAVRSLFCCLLAERCKVDFMGIVEWFLGIHFSWRLTSSLVAVQLNQSGFHPTWLKASSTTHGTLLQRLRLIDQVSLLMPLPLPRRKTTLQLWNNAKKPIKAWLAVLVGSLAPLVLILGRSILSWLCITTNHPQDIWKRYSTHSLQPLYAWLWYILFFWGYCSYALFYPFPSFHRCRGLQRCCSSQAHQLIHPL